MASKNIIELKDIKKSFKVGEQTVNILKGINMDIEYGDFVILFGPSGCGKSTLLHIVLGLEGPTTGTLKFLDDNIYKDGTNEDYRSEFRKKHIGMIYQQPNWIKSLSVLENIAFPLLLLGLDKPAAYKRALQALEIVGMQDWKSYVPTELSSGQQQRIALARGIINNPEIIIADEPTGNLDHEAGEKLMEILLGFNKDVGKTILMVTHDLEYIKYCKTAIKMVDGVVEGVYRGDDKEEMFKTLHFKRGVVDQGEQGEQKEQGEKTDKTDKSTPVEKTDKSSVKLDNKTQDAKTA